MNSLEASKFVELYDSLPAFSIKAKQLITNAITKLNIQLELPLFFEVSISRMTKLIEIQLKNF